MKHINGVTDTYVGYMTTSKQKIKQKPSYKTVSKGNTLFAETVKVTYDPKVISYETLVEKFFESHDPTTLNKQGNDIGKQYRSIAFYSNKNEKEIIQDYIDHSDLPIVTEVQKKTKFFKAEEYHQDYNEKMKSFRQYTKGGGKKKKEKIKYNL
jgi:peptide-methionine (S)-S-oxide reductase